MRYGRTSVVSFLSKLAVSFFGFFGTIVLTRILGREQYGTYVVVLSVLAWVVVAGNMGISGAVKKRVSEQDGVDYLVPGAVSQLILFAVVSVLLWVLRPHLNDYMGIEATGVVIVLLLARLGVGFVSAVLDGQRMVHVSSVLQPFQRTIQSVTQVGLVLAGFGLAGAFAGVFVGALAATIVGLYFVSSRLQVPSLEEFRRIKSYAQFSWFAHVRGQTFMSMDTLILAVFVTNSLVGGYKAAWNLASIFATFSIAIQRTLFPEISALASQEDSDDAIAGLFTESLAYAGLIIIPGVVGSVLLGDVVLRVYGEGFASGYYILIILSVARLLYGYQSQFLNTIDALDYPELTFRINIVFVGLNLVLNVVLSAVFGWYGAAAATTFSAVVGTLLGYRYLSSLLDVRIPFREVGNQFVAAGVMALVVLPGRVEFSDTLPIAVALATVGAAVYFVTLLGISPKFRKTVDDNLPFALPLIAVD